MWRTTNINRRLSADTVRANLCQVRAKFGMNGGLRINDLSDFCSRDCGEAAKNCTIMPCHEIELIQEFPTTDTDSDTISRAKAIETIDSFNVFESRGDQIKLEQMIGELPPAQPEITHEQAVGYLQSTGWMQSHDLQMMLDGIHKFTAQPQRIRGRWISADAIFGGEPFYCSECGENTRDTVMGKPRWNFCPNCGADMREVTE